MKEPGFYFYVNNWLGGTLHFNPTQKGLYMDLLILQFTIGPFTITEAKNAIGEKYFNDEWFVLEKKFVRDGDVYYNERMKADADLKKFRSDAGKKGNESRWKGKQESQTVSQTVSQTPSQTPSQNDRIDTDTDIDIDILNIDTENEKKDKRRSRKNCLMKNSGVTVKDIKEAFEKTDDIAEADPLHYFNAILDWSTGSGKLKMDWIAVIRGAARRDLADAKMKLNPKISNFKDPLESEQRMKDLLNL